MMHRCLAVAPLFVFLLTRPLRLLLLLLSLNLPPCCPLHLTQSLHQRVQCQHCHSSCQALPPLPRPMASWQAWCRVRRVHSVFTRLLVNNRTVHTTHVKFTFWHRLHVVPTICSCLAPCMRCSRCEAGGTKSKGTCISCTISTMEREQCMAPRLGLAVL